jgi:hypothetical protein
MLCEKIKITILKIKIIVIRPSLLAAGGRRPPPCFAAPREGPPPAGSKLL